MPSGCCVPDCINRTAKSKLVLHKLPKNILYREKWLQMFVNAKVHLAKSSRICSRHFERHQYKNLKKNILKREVIPVLFMPKPVENTLQINLETQLPDTSVQDTNLRENSPKLIDNSPELAPTPVKTYDFNKTCRICLLEKPDLQNMDTEFIQKMFQSTDIVKFSATDTFAKHICAVCFSELEVVHNFTLKCGKSNDVFRQFTNPEQTANGSVDRKSLSKTVEVSYIPTETDMRNKEDTHRSYNYKLVAVDNIQKTNLLSLAQLKESSSASAKPVLTSTVQAFEIQSSEIGKPNNCSSENENTVNLSVNSSVTRNNNSFDCNINLENKDIVKNINCSSKRMLRKRKLKAIASEESKEVRKTQAVVPTERNITLEKDTTMNVVDLTEEKVTHHSRSARRHSRTAGRISRSRSGCGRMRNRCGRMRSRSKRQRSRSNRPFSRRKMVASGNAVYWYDKPVQSAGNQMNSSVDTELENESMDTSGDFLGFDNKSNVGEMKDDSGEKRMRDDTARDCSGTGERNVGIEKRNAGIGERNAALVEETGRLDETIGLAERNAGSSERNVGSAKRNAGSAETTGLAERTTGLAERTTDPVERTSRAAEKKVGAAETTDFAERNTDLAATIAGFLERSTDSTETTTDSTETTTDSTKTTTISVERTTDSLETTTETVLNAHSAMHNTQVKQSSTILKCQPTNINAGEENTTSGVQIQKRSRGRPRKRRRLTIGKLETVCCDSLSMNTAATELACKVDNCRSENDVTNNLTAKNENCNIKNDSTNNLIPKNEKFNIKNDTTNNLIAKNENCNIKNNNSNNLTAKNENCNIKTDNTNNLILKNESYNIKTDTTNNLTAKNENCNIKNNNTNNLIPQNKKCNTEITTTPKCNTKPSKSTTKKYKSTHRNTKIDPAIVNTEDNSILTEKQTVSKTDTITNTSEQLPTEEPVTSIKNCQPNSDKTAKQTKTPINTVENEDIYMKLRHKTVKFAVDSQQWKLRYSDVNIKHLHISKKEFNKLINVKLELSKLKINYKESNHCRSKISVGKKKVRILNTTSENRRILRSSKINTIDNETSVVNNFNSCIKLDKECVLQNVVDENKDIIKTTKVSECNSVLNVQSCEEPKQFTDLEDICGVDKMSAIRVDKMADSSANITVKDETRLQDNTDTCEIDTFEQTNTNVKIEEPKKVKIEQCNCSPDTTTNHDTYSMDSEAELPKNEAQTELKSSTECTQSTEIPLIETTVNEHVYSMNTKESLPKPTEQDLPVQNELNPLETSPMNKAINNSADSESKYQLKQLLQEYVVFEENCSRTDELVENTALPTENYSTKNYYQDLDSETDDAQVLNSDAMLSTVLKLSPVLKVALPTVYEDELNESFEMSINNILNTEYNTVCDGQLVGAGIVLEDVAANEEVLPTTIDPVYQHVPEKSPKTSANSDSSYFNKQSKISSPAEEICNYSSEDEYYTNKFNTWLPSSTELFEPVQPSDPSTTDGLHNNVVRSTAEQNFPYKCEVCDIAFNTKEMLNSHTIYAEHVTKRFCKYCKQPVDIAEFTAHLKQHENEMYCCEYCGEMVYELKKFIRHGKIHRRHKCKLCPMEFDTKFLLSQHLTVHTGVRRDQCRFCHREFARTSALIKHLAARTCLKEQFICTVCKKIFDTKKKTMMHVAQHHRFECTICSRTFSSEELCMNHLKVVHGIIQNE